MQSAYHEIDTYCLPQRAHAMLTTILKFYELAGKSSEEGTTVAEIRSSPLVYKISRMKDIPHDEFDERIKQLWDEMEVGLASHKGVA